MKKFFALSLVLAAVLSASVAVAAPVTLVYAEVNPLDTIVGQVATVFKQKVEELSGGEITIDVQAGGVLGTEAQILDGILGGGDTVDIMRISAFALSSYGCQKAMLLSIPYTFVSREHFWKFANSDLAAEFLAEPNQIGLPLRGICYGEEGFRHFFFKDPVTGLKDLKGKKIRVSEDPVMTGMVRNLGASPTVVNFTELYSALQTGVTDAAEQPIANYRSNAFQEVAPYLLLDGHTLGAIQIIVADTGWNKLNDQQRAWIMEAGKFTQQENAKISQAAEDKVLEELKAGGTHVIEVENKAEWVEACQETIKANTASQAELYQKLVDLQ
ncbi:MAG: TRAP transporter substrate-binding protein [Synergistaceae bacterium]|nr:TRAP transporter substrate-binding protein [Synergistaceae bacterium]MBR0094795.1 TRAP transporter substrate-binding protein [Synergistaceae bacterium]